MSAPLQTQSSNPERGFQLLDEKPPFGVAGQGNPPHGSTTGTGYPVPGDDCDKPPFSVPKEGDEPKVTTTGTGFPVDGEGA